MRILLRIFCRAIGGMTGIPAATASSATTLLAEAIGVAKSISASLTATAAQPLVRQVEADVNAAIQALASLSLPKSVSAVLQAAQVLLPVIETAVGLMVPAAATPNAMSPAQARAILKAA